MNKAILHQEVQNFINTNLNTDIAKLIFKGSPSVRVRMALKEGDGLSIKDTAQVIFSTKSYTEF